MGGGAYEAEIRIWRDQHEQSLAREDGWLAQIALEPLGDAPVTHDIGTFSVRDGEPYLDDQPVRVDDVLVAGTRRYEVIRRGGALSLRVRDSEAPARKSFRGLRWYPIDPAWRIEGELAAAAARTPMQFTGGEEELALSPGPVTFQISGTEHTLVPYVRARGELLFVFRDATNGDTTYDLCRYFYAPPPDAGRVVLDFNKAAAPICALVPFVTCVLPPPANRLGIRVEAGELRYEP
jgi:uncharacterized protein (DUF1684 family)